MLEPVLAILAIVIPLGLAYIIIMLQARKLRGENCDYCNPNKT